MEEVWAPPDCVSQLPAVSCCLVLKGAETQEGGLVELSTGSLCCVGGESAHQREQLRRLLSQVLVVI